MIDAILERIASRDTQVGIVGLGYVGLPLAMTFVEAGFHVVGIDVSAERVATLNAGRSVVEDVPDALVAAAVERGMFTATTDYEVVRDIDAVSICVPTPLRKTRDPDMSFIVSAAEALAERARPGQLIVLESTTYPGTTRELLVPLFEARGLTAGEDVFLAFSPERVDPGREDWTTVNTPKVLGGLTPNCLTVARALYESAMETIVPVSSPEVAELTKIYENTFRAVNIGLANELLLMCDKLGLDPWEVIDAAATKPFGFMKFTPGPGLGGHCIPVDPHYLSWKLKSLNYTARFIELASEVNTGMPLYWVQQVQDALNEKGLPLRNSTVLLLGVAYKKDISDMRESPALDIILLLQERGAHVTYHDPHVPELRHGDLRLHSEADLEGALQAADCVLVVTDHSAYDWQRIVARAESLIDTRAVTRHLSETTARIVEAS